MLRKICILICLSSAILAYAETFKAENYAQVEIARLKATPEEYKMKRICYESEYWGYETTFPPYVEKSGFKAGKDFCLLIKPVSLPVMAEKSKEMNELVPALKNGSTVKVYGKVKKFMSEPDATMMPHYYLELEKIEVVEKPAQQQEAKNETRRERRAEKAEGKEENASPWRRDIGLPQNPQKR